MENTNGKEVEPFILENNVGNVISQGDNIDETLANVNNVSLPEESEKIEDEAEEVTLKEMIDCSEWRQNHKHVFILSSAGKPVYSRYGSEDKLATIFGVMQALVSFVQDSDDSIRSIHFEQNIMVFSIKGPIILVAVSNRKDSIEFISTQLTYVYNQIVSVLTLSRVTKIFEKRHNYDLRRLLTGSERLIDHLLTFSETQPEFLLDAVSCLKMQSAQREAISNAIISTCSKIKTLVFAMLIGCNRLITLVRRKKYSLQPSDLHLIFNLVNSSESFKTAESWTPICLPNFDATGFLHGHVSYLAENCQACLLLLTVDQNIFFELSAAKKAIVEKLEKNQLFDVINEGLKKPNLTVNDIPKIYKMRHFIFKCKKSSHLLSPVLPVLYNTPAAANNLMFQYQQLYSTIHQPGSLLKLAFQQLPNETMLGWVTEKFELMVTFEPLINKRSATDGAKKLSQIIEKDEDKFFIQNIYNF
ncbi:protein SAND [Cimex lectularius]|uniref:Vacuolar fusion protein MON1 homolog n=1 Tax=Cimex lectularius TaxID=79782 RepID=A0A8I6RL85_CIMLE|nr:protein SAND [Cimex lectularius]